MAMKSNFLQIRHGVLLCNEYQYGEGDNSDPLYRISRAVRLNRLVGADKFGRKGPGTDLSRI